MAPEDVVVIAVGVTVMAPLGLVVVTDLVIAVVSALEAAREVSVTEGKVLDMEEALRVVSVTAPLGLAVVTGMVVSVSAMEEARVDTEDIALVTEE